MALDEERDFTAHEIQNFFIHAIDHDEAVKRVRRSAELSGFGDLPESEIDMKLPELIGDDVFRSAFSAVTKAKTGKSNILNTFTIKSDRQKTDAAREAHLAACPA